MSNIISIFKNQRSLSYESYIGSLDKQDLIDEMVRFQQERSDEGRLTLSLMIRGIPLFGAIESISETSALRALAKSYKIHLIYELEHFRE